MILRTVAGKWSTYSADCSLQAELGEELEKESFASKGSRRKERSQMKMRRKGRAFFGFVFIFIMEVFSPPCIVG